MTGNKQIVKHEVVEDKVITQKPRVKRVSRRPRNNYINIKLEIRLF